MASNQVGLPASLGAALKTMISLPGPTDCSGVSYETASAVARLVAQEPVLFPTTKPCAYLTGGWVRDRVLGKSAADVDVEVFGVPKDRLLAVLQERFPHRVIAPSDNPTAPIKVLAGGGLYIDITIPIRCTAAHGSSRVSAALAPEISVAEAASRRDFSCNAIYFDPIREQYIDPEGGLGERLTAELVLQALWQAILIQQPPAGLLVHTDRGSQYTSDKFIALAQGNKLTLSLSMSRRGNCWDNAVAESFFNSLKRELISGEKIRTRKQLHTSLTESLNIYYNTVRMYSTLDYVSLMEYENKAA